LPVGQEAEVTDAHEATRKQVKQEAAQELIDRQGHEPLLATMSGVPPAKGDVALGESNQPVVGDGDAVGVSTEIAQRVLRSAEGPLGVNDPVMPEQESKPGGEGSRFSQRGEVAVELECALAEGGLKSGDELTAEDTAEHRDGKEEGVAGGDPSGVAGSEATGGNDAVDMRMNLQTLVPGVKHAEESDVRSQVPGIAGDLQQGGGAGVKEQIVDHPFVL